jgi:hypothetical protein
VRERFDDGEVGRRGGVGGSRERLEFFFPLRAERQRSEEAFLLCFSFERSEGAFSRLSFERSDSGTKKLSLV